MIKKALILIIALFLISDAYSSASACLYNTVMVWNCINNSADFTIIRGVLINATITCCLTGAAFNESNYDVSIVPIFNESRPYSPVTYYNGTSLITIIDGPAVVQPARDYNINVTIYLPSNSTYSGTNLPARIDVMLDTKMGLILNNVITLSLMIPVNYNDSPLLALLYYVKSNSLIIGVLIASSAVLAYYAISKREQI